MDDCWPLIVLYVDQRHGYARTSLGWARTSPIGWEAIIMANGLGQNRTTGCAKGGVVFHLKFPPWPGRSTVLGPWLIDNTNGQRYKQ